MIRHPNATIFALLISIFVLPTGIAAMAAETDVPAKIRIENLTLPPVHLPLVMVKVTNTSDAPLTGELKIDVPEDWRMTDTVKPVELPVGASDRIFFPVEKGTTLSDNRYPIGATLTVGDLKIQTSRNVVAAVAPYFKPTIDGETDDWKDSIPARFSADPNIPATIVSTYWNRRTFSMLVEVEEDQLVTRGEQPNHDAVQIAIAPRKITTGNEPTDEAERFEFLVVPTGNGAGACYRLASPGDTLGETQTATELTDDLLESGAQVAVARRDGKTIYEISISFSPMRSKISPSEGREFQMSLLVHDPDGTGVRDWGAAVGLKPGPDSRYAWSHWKGEKGSADGYCDSKTSWGMCSSKY